MTRVSNSSLFAAAQQASFPLFLRYFSRCPLSSFSSQFRRSFIATPHCVQLTPSRRTRIKKLFCTVLQPFSKTLYGGSHCEQLTLPLLLDSRREAHASPPPVATRAMTIFVHRKSSLSGENQAPYRHLAQPNYFNPLPEAIRRI